MLKSRDILSVPREDIVKVCTSSGTNGSISRVMRNAKSLDIPIIVAGKRIDDGKKYEFAYETGATVRIPKVTPEMVAAVRDQDRMAVHDMTVAEVSGFIGKVGDLWKDGCQLPPAPRVHQACRHGDRLLRGDDRL